MTVTSSSALLRLAIGTSVLALAAPQVAMAQDQAQPSEDQVAAAADPAPADDVIVVPMRVDHVAHGLVRLFPDGREHTAGRRLVRLSVDGDDLVATLDDAGIRFHRKSGRIIAHDREHTIAQSGDRKLFGRDCNARECEQRTGNQ